jgi:hypothetical protein
MPAVFTVNQICLHVCLQGLIVNLPHTCILPRILNRIGEDNLAASNVKATIMRVVPVNYGSSTLNIVLTEHCFTERFPIIKGYKLRAKRVDSPGCLEPAEFRTDLPSPLSHVLVDIICHILKQSSIIPLIAWQSLPNGYLLNNGQNQGDIYIFYTHQDIAQCSSSTALDFSCENIGQIVHIVSVI